MIGAQASNDQLEKILSYIQIGKDEGARVVCGGERVDLGGDLSDGYYVAPTIFEGKNSMRIFQEEIFGPVVSVTSFTDFDDAMHIANDTLYGLGAGVWSRNINTAYRAGRTIQAGRVWTNCYHAYPAHAAFGGYKGSGIGRRTTCGCSSTTSRPRTCWSATPAEARLLLNAHRVDVTEEAADMLRRLFGEAGRSCSTSPAAAATAVPRCATRPGRFLVTEGADVLWGVLDVQGVGDVPVYMSAPQYEYWKHTHLTIDLVPGRGAGSRSEAPTGFRFLIRSRLLTDEEYAALG